MVETCGGGVTSNLFGEINMIHFSEDAGNTRQGAEAQGVAVLVLQRAIAIRPRPHAGNARSGRQSIVSFYIRPFCI